MSDAIDHLARCVTCDYDLRGTLSAGGPRCPECGQAVSGASLALARERSFFRRLRRVLLLLFAITVVHEGEAVGMGRVIGDGGCFLEVVDIAVVPEHRGRGLGRRIMQEVMGFIEGNALPGAYVSLITDSPAFYERFGFRRSAPDEAMFVWFPTAGEG